MILNQRIRLNGTKQERIIQALHMAGWQSERPINLSNIEKYYTEKGIELICCFEIMSFAVYSLFHISRKSPHIFSQSAASAYLSAFQQSFDTENRGISSLKIRVSQTGYTA